MTSTTTRLMLITLATSSLLIGGLAVRAQQLPRTQAPPDLSGGWVRLDTSGSGSFGGLTEKFSRAVLTPAGVAGLAPARDPDDVEPDARPHREGEPYIVTEGRCGGGGGGVEPNSAAFFVVQSAEEVLLLREGPGARHVYMDGRTHPDLSRWTPSGNGHSTGRYEGGALVVETIGLTPGAVTAGGRRTPETKLIERYRLSADGKRMTITFTWTDPKIFVKPHTYEFSFDRLPANGYAFENWCDSGDPLQRQSVVPPKQIE